MTTPAASRTLRRGRWKLQDLVNKRLLLRDDVARLAAGMPRSAELLFGNSNRAVEHPIYCDRSGPRLNRPCSEQTAQRHAGRQSMAAQLGPEGRRGAVVTAVPKFEGYVEDVTPILGGRQQARRRRRLAAFDTVAAVSLLECSTFE